MTESDPAKPVQRTFRFKLFLYGFLGTAILLILAGLTSPQVIRSAKKPNQTEATSNLRQIGLALLEFETEYGSYPSEATAALVTKKHPDHGYDLSGTSSNALFRQLFAAGITQSEQMFYAKTQGSKKPDGNISPGHVLEPGECGFAYIAGLSTKGNPSHPISFAPVIPGTDRFDLIPFEGKAVVLRIDNSVPSMNINQDGDAMAGGGKTLLETGDDTVWGDHVPDIRYPEIPTPSKPSFFQKLFHK